MNLFVAGCPRSGTTALTRLLNLHPDVVIGLERFKGLYGKKRDVAADLFTEERFFNFSPVESNFVPEKSEEARLFYGKAKEKFAAAAYVGDKYPQFFRFYGTMFKTFPNARFIFIFRDPSYVAQSWQRRAEDTSRWPAENDASKAVDYWNDSLAYTLAYTQIKRSAFTFVEYNEFFSARGAGLIDLLRRIGARVTPEIEAEITASAQAEYARSEMVLERGMELPKDVVRSVKHAADMNLYKRARRILEAQQAEPAPAG